MICDYGCGKEAKHQFKNGKWCCSKNYQLCPNKRRIGNKNPFYKKLHSKETKDKISIKNKGQMRSDETRKNMRNSALGRKLSQEIKDKISKSSIGKQKGRIPWNKGLKGIYSNDTIKQMKKNKKLKISYITDKYLIFSKIEEMRYNPNKPGKKEIQVHCKNHNCLNSKEQGGWFEPTYIQLYERIRQLENLKGNGGSYLYCSDECKQECPLYNMRPTSIINQNNLPNENYYTNEEYQIFRNEVLKRADHICEYCGEPANIVHHSRPQKLEPFHSLDPDFGIACCESCHYKYGHKDECTTIKIATKVCS